MEIVFLISIIFGLTVQNVLKKAYNNKLVNGGAFVFNALTVLSACAFFFVTAEHPLSFNLEMLPYSLGFAACYSIAAIFSMLAIREGSLSITSLALSYSLLIPTVFGLIFYGDEASVFLFIGIALLIVSILLINNSPKQAKSDSTAQAESTSIPSTEVTGSGGVKFTLRWLIFVLLSFLSNGFCTTIQNAYAKSATGSKNEFMIIALLTVFLVLVCAVAVSEKDKIKPSLKGGWYLMVICGIANGVVNLFVILLSPLMDSSVMFPLISAGGIVLTSLVSIFFYKEKLTVRQYVGMVLGIASIVFLNI